MPSKAIILHPGEQVVVPIGTDITAVIINGSISVSSTCPGLPSPTSQTCYKMEWSTSQDASSNYTLEHTEARINYIKIGGVQYDIDLEPTDWSNLETAFGNITTQIPGIFDFSSLSHVDLANRYDASILFKSVADIAVDIEMNITGDGYPTNGLFIKPFESGGCDAEE